MRERVEGDPEPGTSCRTRPRPSWRARGWPRDVPVKLIKLINLKMYFKLTQNNLNYTLITSIT